LLIAIAGNGRLELVSASWETIRSRNYPGDFLAISQTLHQACSTDLF